MKLVPLILQHVLVVCLLYLTCGRSLLQRQPQTEPALRRRMTGYWNTMCWQWACVAVLLVAMPFPQIMYLSEKTSNRSASVDALMFIVLGNILMGMYVPIALAWGNGAIRRWVLAPFVAVRTWLPTTPRQRVSWVALSVTTGICEELLFRGFLIQYLMRQPFALGLTMSGLISCAIFAVGHAYQGRRGVLQTLLFSIAMIGLLLATGSLVAPIVVHVLVNLRIAFLPSYRMRVAIA